MALRSFWAYWVNSACLVDTQATWSALLMPTPVATSPSTWAIESPRTSISRATASASSVPWRRSGSSTATESSVMASKNGVMTPV